jgi:hypothetical protein
MKQGFNKFAKNLKFNGKNLSKDFDPLEFENRKIVKKDDKYIYYFDNYDVLRKVRHDQKSTDAIRLKFLEKPYRWWVSLSYDTRNSIIPLFLGFSALFLLHEAGWYLTQREVLI